MNLSVLAALLLAHQPAHAATQTRIYTARIGLTGSPYLKARLKLRQSGYKPIKMGYPAGLCSDRSCKRIFYLNEGQCAVDISICLFYWRSPQGHYLKVETNGEWNPRITNTEWVTHDEFSYWTKH